MVDPVIYQLQADLCRSMSHPARQQILHILFEGPRTVNEIANIIQQGQSTVSRHLAVLRQTGLINSHRHGQEIIYQVVNPKVAEVCALMRTVLLDQISERSKISAEFK